MRPYAQLEARTPYEAFLVGVIRELEDKWYGVVMAGTVGAEPSGLAVQSVVAFLRWGAGAERSELKKLQVNT